MSLKSHLKCQNIPANVDGVGVLRLLEAIRILFKIPNYWISFWKFN